LERSEIPGKFWNVVRRKMENDSWTDRVINEVWHRVKQVRSIVHRIKIMKTYCIGHIFCSSCLLKHGVEGKLDRRTDGKTRKKTNKLFEVHKETEDTGNWQKKYLIALCGEFALEEAVDLSQGRLRRVWIRNKRWALLKEGNVLSDSVK
jgi:hypothetical protein